MTRGAFTARGLNGGLYGEQLLSEVIPRLQQPSGLEPSGVTAPQTSELSCYGMKPNNTVTKALLCND